MYNPKSLYFFRTSLDALHEERKKDRPFCYGHSLRFAIFWARRDQLIQHHIK